MSAAISQLASPTGGAQVFQPPPHIAPPFRAKPLTGVQRVVLQPAAAAPGSPGAVGALALSVAEGLPGSPLLLLPSTSGIGSLPQVVVTFTTPQGYRTVLTHVGVEVGDGDLDSVLFRVVLGGQPFSFAVPSASGGTPLFNPTQLALVSTLTDPTPIPANVPENTTIQIWAQNLDPNVGVLVSGALFGWTYPALQQADSLASSLSQAPCAPSGTDRLDCPPCGPGGYGG